MHAWVFRHLDRLREIYGSDAWPGSGQAADPIEACPPAPGTTSLVHLGETGGSSDVLMTPMERRMGAPPAPFDRRFG